VRREIWFDKVLWSYIPCHWKGWAVSVAFVLPTVLGSLLGQSILDHLGCPKQIGCRSWFSFCQRGFRSSSSRSGIAERGAATGNILSGPMRRQLGACRPAVPSSTAERRLTGARRRSRRHGLIESDLTIIDGPSGSSLFYLSITVLRRPCKRQSLCQERRDTIPTAATRPNRPRT
jgi:hypothetical protein